MSDNKIGEFIAEKRREKGLTQQELGDKLFVTDKAVSKWERGISFPDITLLKKLASILEVDVNELLDGEKNKNKNNIEERIREIQDKINEKNRKKRIKLVIGIVILFIILIIVIFKNISFGYSIKSVHYNHADKDIKLGIPKGSFFIKNNDRSYSIKNLRSANIIENETKRYLKTLSYSNCNDTIYYYDKENNFSIINYGIKDNFFFSKLSYEIVEYDYCITKQLEDYSSKLGYVRGFHTLNGGKIDLNRTGNMLEVLFQDDFKEYPEDSEKITDIYSFKAKMQVRYYKNIEKILETKNVDMTVLEESIGRFEIKDDKLYFFREKIIESKIKLPEVSTFRLENGKMYLIENYLSDYEDEIVLK